VGKNYQLTFPMALSFFRGHVVKI